MKTYLSILRGINVSGHKTIKMNELKDLFTKIGFKNPVTYIQSGNVVFQFEETETGKISKQIENAISEKFNFEVPVITRTLEEFKMVIDDNIFIKQIDIQVDKLHITFLSHKPDQKTMDSINELDFSPDRFLVSNREVFIYCPNGYGNTKLSNGFFEKKLKVVATTRNLKTVKELIRIAEEIA